MAVLEFLSKLKRNPGVAFDAHFLYDFSIKLFPHLTLHQWPKFQCHTFFSSQDIKQNVLYSSYLDS